MLEQLIELEILQTSLGEMKLLLATLCKTGFISLLVKVLTSTMLKRRVRLSERLHVQSERSDTIHVSSGLFISIQACPGGNFSCFKAKALYQLKIEALSDAKQRTADGAMTVYCQEKPLRVVNNCEV